MKTIVAILALFPLIVFGGVSTGPSTLTPAQLAAAGVVTNKNIKLVNVTGANPSVELANTNSDFFGQIGETWSGGTFALAPSFSTTPGAGFRGSFFFPYGFYQVGDPFITEAARAGMNWYFNGGTNSLQSQNEARSGAYFYVHNLQVFGDGSGFCVPHYSTNRTGFVAYTNSDGVQIWQNNRFGNQLLTISENDTVGETNQAGSYVWLTQTDLPTYISANKTLSGETGAFYSQHYFVGFDMNGGYTHFAKLIPYVWTFTNANNRDAFTINNNTGDIEATNGNITLGNSGSNITLNAKLIRVSPHPGYDSVVAGLAVNTNADFNSEDAAWTFDAGSGNARIGFVKKAGAYTRLVHASGAPLIISRSSSGNLQTTAVASQTLTDELTVQSDGSLNFNGATFWGGIAQFTNGISSLSSNLLAPASITFPASGVNWTNTTGRNIGVFVDTAGVTGTTTSINGTQIYSSMVGDMFLPLQAGEYFSMAYTVGTPTAKIKPQ